MKSIVSFFTLLLLSSSLLAQTVSEEEKLLGMCQRGALEEAPYRECFQPFYNGYEPKQEVLDEL